MIYKPTKAYKKIDQLCRKYKKNVIKGGQGSSKTVSIIMLLANECIKVPNTEATIFGHEGTKLRATAGRDFVKIMKSWNWFNPDKWTNKSLYKFENGSYLEFVGLDRDDIGKGFRRDFTYFNEANRGITFEKYHQAASRTRKKIFLDYNPDAEFWVDEELIPYDDCGVLTVTYEDNQFLPEGELEEILSYKIKGFHNPDLPVEQLFHEENIKNNYWANKHKVYALGLTGSLQGAILQNWTTGEFNDILPFVYGLDFGVDDPDALVKIAVDRDKKLVYAKLEMYKNGQSTGELIEAIDRICQKNDLIAADYGEKRKILDLREAGFNAVNCYKSTIIERIKDILDYTIIVDPESKTLQKELNNWKWHDKRAEVPVDKDNHAIDAMFYGFNEISNANEMFIG